MALKRVLMLAAENGSIPGSKVGGMADVIRDLPQALGAVDLAVDVAMPGYGFLAEAAGAKWLADIRVPFAGALQNVSVFKAPNPNVPDSYFYLFEHPIFANASGAGGNRAYQVYSQGEASRPFAEDATKFALFCASVAEALRQVMEQESTIMPGPELVHLHDWHSGMFALLRAFHSRYSVLQQLVCVFSIHNLALQGIRPLRNESSSLEAWFPELLAGLDDKQLDAVTDPRYRQCINPMKAGIVLSDRVHLVSPSYAQEVLLPSSIETGFIGGEGLEGDLQAKAQDGALLGILNGCVYPNTQDSSDESKFDSVVSSCSQTDADGDRLASLLTAAETALLGWQGCVTHVRSQDFIAQARIQRLWRRRQRAVPPFLLTSVGRLTDQKVLILRQRLGSDLRDDSLVGKTVLEALLERLVSQAPDGIFMMLGSGDEEISREFTRVAAKHDNFIFLDGYDEALSDSLYRMGDLFLMPSSFEPCGISQMLAMREGQLCLVNRVGGLKDTVHHKETGFVFEGASVTEQGLELLATFGEAMTLQGTPAWLEMQEAARVQRFEWLTQAKRYREELYLL